MINLGKIFKKGLQGAFRERSQVYKTCEELPLYNFMQVVSTGDYKYLYKKIPSKCTEDLSMIWGDIILEYGKLDNNMGVMNSFEADKHLRQLCNSYTAIKAMIRLLFLTGPNHPKHGELAKQTISDLLELGYKIDTSSNEKYKASLFQADKRANNIITRIRMKKNEMKGDEDEKGISYDAIMAMLSSSLKFSIPEDITVARYCEYKKIIKSRSSNGRA